MDQVGEEGGREVGKRDGDLNPTRNGPDDQPRPGIHSIPQFGIRPTQMHIAIRENAD